MPLISEHLKIQVETVHCPGKDNIHADALSRNAVNCFYRHHQEHTRRQQIFPSATSSASPGLAAQLDVVRLDQVVHSLYQAGLAQSTQKHSYTAGKRRYIEFYDKFAAVPLLMTERQLCWFVAYLLEEGLRYQTVKSYLAAVRHMQILHEIGDPRIGSMPRVVRGMKREQASQPTRTRLPITSEILGRIRQYWKGRQDIF